MKRVLLGCLSACSFLASASDTVLKLYRPFGEVTKQVAPVIKNTVTGQCDAQSQLVIREDAWRCQVEGKIIDPCFVKAGNNRVEALCPQSPWVADSVQIKVALPFNNEHHKPLDMSRAFPWAIELNNGERCQAIDAHEVYDSMPIRYRCTKQNSLIGYIQRCKPLWSMLEKTSEGVVTVDFKTVWF